MASKFSGPIVRVSRAHEKNHQNPSKVFELVIFARENPTYILYEANQVFIIRIEYGLDSFIF